MGPALQPYIFVGQGPCALPWVRYGIGGRTESSAPTEAQQKVQWAGDRKGRPYGGLQAVQGAGRCVERAERCRWQRKRSERVAAVKILSVRREAAQKFWAPQQGHRPLRKRYKRCNGRATARVAPTKALQEVRGRNPPVTATPCQPPLGKGAEGTGERIATASLRTGLAMTGGYMGCGVRRDTWVPPYNRTFL